MVVWGHGLIPTQIPITRGAGRYKTFSQTTDGVNARTPNEAGAGMLAMYMIGVGDQRFMRDMEYYLKAKEKELEALAPGKVKKA